MPQQVSLPVAEEILRQLGGRRFTLFTGARNYVGSSTFLMFTIPLSRGVNKVKIVLDPSDTYTITGSRVHGRNVTDVQVMEGVYCDALQEAFTEITGLYTRF